MPQAPVTEALQASVTEVPQASVAEEPAEVAHLPAPAEVPHLPALTDHLPDQGTLHLPGASPVLAAEAPAVETAPSAVPPSQAASSTVWAALP
jgi:hypothetical protein